jgi:hypothetical protein
MGIESAHAITGVKYLNSLEQMQTPRCLKVRLND